MYHYYHVPSYHVRLCTLFIFLKKMKKGIDFFNQMVFVFHVNLCVTYVTYMLFCGPHRTKSWKCHCMD